MKIRTPIFITAISAALAGAPVMAATSISSGFAGPALDAGLTQTHAEPSTTLTLSGTAAFTGGANNNYRSYVGTVGSDYAVSTNNWTATIEVRNSGFVGAQLYFGLGTGTSIDNNDPIYGTPQGSTESQPATFMFMYDPTFEDSNTAPLIRSVGTVRKQSNQGYWAGETNYSDAQFDTRVGTTGGVASGAFYRYSMAYDYLSQTLTFDVDQISGFGGTVTSSAAGNFGVLSLTGMGYDSSNGKIFFGGNNNTFDNLSVTVVPEPSAALLGGLGMLCLLRRRR
jgi:hypothetical protein